MAFSELTAVRHLDEQKNYERIYGNLRYFLHLTGALDGGMVEFDGLDYSRIALKLYFLLSALKDDELPDDVLERWRKADLEHFDLAAYVESVYPPESIDKLRAIEVLGLERLDSTSSADP